MRTTLRDRGESLLEVLLAVALLGTVVVVLLGGMAVSVIGSRESRAHADDQWVLRSMAEAVAATEYADCAAAQSAYSAAAAKAAQDLTGTTAARYGNPAVQIAVTIPGAADSTGIASWSPCSSAGDAAGVQRVSLSLQPVDGTTGATVDLVKRRSL